MRIYDARNGQDSEHREEDYTQGDRHGMLHALEGGPVPAEGYTNHD